MGTPPHEFSSTGASDMAPVTGARTGAAGRASAGRGPAFAGAGVSDVDPAGAGAGAPNTSAYLARAFSTRPGSPESYAAVRPRLARLLRCRTRALAAL
ncbi:hypothetical protein [Amycolatopsis sp. NPDC054798]